MHNHHQVGKWNITRVPEASGSIPVTLRVTLAHISYAFPVQEHIAKSLPCLFFCIWLPFLPRYVHEIHPSMCSFRCRVLFCDGGQHALFIHSTNFQHDKDLNPENVLCNRAKVPFWADAKIVRMLKDYKCIWKYWYKTNKKEDKLWAMDKWIRWMWSSSVDKLGTVDDEVRHGRTNTRPP